MKKEKPETKLCKYCKTEIPFDAKVCPNCRKKQGGKGCLIAIAVFVVIIIIAIATSSGGSSSSNKTASQNSGTSADNQTATPETEEILEVAPGDLLDSYEANEVKGDELYEGKKMKLTGVVNDIGKDVMEHVYITFKGNDQYSITCVQCFFDSDDEIKKVMDLQSGDTITVVGDCTGKFGNVTIEHCVIQ